MRDWLSHTSTPEKTIFIFAFRQGFRSPEGIRQGAKNALKKMALEAFGRGAFLLYFYKQSIKQAYSPQEL